ncbi:hypothetical protein AAVH_23194 [Aphelenchoides avenae]|nr:hypothetical protein AAVH_23194 [Aphelenchus avenae]
MPTKTEAIAGVKKVQQRLAVLMKGNDPNPIPKELFTETGTMVFRGAKGYNGHAAIAKAFKNYINIDCVMNNEKFLVTEGGEYVIALGHMDVGTTKKCPFEKIYKHVGNDKYVIVHDEFGGLAGKAA